MAGTMMGSADVKYEATETGARLIFTPKDPKQRSELQARVREMAERMGKGMMEETSVPKTTTLYFSKTPDCFRETPQFKAV